ncbi:soma ferritin-like [Euwallacea fornicatus]|uniref:soma ferritin-like n=1 Tax=Euwallacea fornicatus TaxID=995702 RepID=UPI00338F4DEC
MAVLMQKRFIRFLFDVPIPHRKQESNIFRYFLNEFRRGLGVNLNYDKKRSKSIFYKANLAKFYNDSKQLYNVSICDNLVKQKSSGDGSSKYCKENKEYPGRLKFHKEIERALNEQVKMEFNASFTYLSMASYYGRNEVALPGCQGFFFIMHQEEHEHAIIFLNYILMRGGHVRIPTVSPPKKSDWKDISKTFTEGVRLECQVKEKLEELVKLSEKHRDYQLVDFISGEFLEEQNRSIQCLGRLLTRSKMVNSDVGAYLFDQHLYDSFVRNSKDNLMYTLHLPAESDTKVYK